GRAFTPGECADGGDPVVILSDGLWRRRFGADPRVIGRALTIEGQSRMVVGVMAPGFRFPEESDLWLPLAINFGNQYKIRLSGVIARLGAGVTLEAARADLSEILGRRRTSPDTQVRVIGLGERLVGNVRRALLAQFGAVVFVLLIACANVADLLLARSAARQKEMAIRAAGGGRRGAAAAHATVADREFDALGGGRRGRAARGEVARQAARGDESRRDRSHPGEQCGWPRPRLHLHGRVVDGTDRRRPSCLASVEDRCQ